MVLHWKNTLILANGTQLPVQTQLPLASKAMQFTPLQHRVHCGIDAFQSERPSAAAAARAVGARASTSVHLVNLPKEYNTYHEIFLGGGSVLFALLKMVQDGHIHVKRKIYAYDFNETLIHLYKNIQSNPSDVFGKTEMLINEFNKIDGNVVNRKPENLSEACTSKESYFYWTRSLFNQLSQIEKNSTYGTALFIFLNKTCFRGVYRVGPNGFNVPYGNYNSPEILNLDHLMEIHELIQPVVFTSCSFEESISKAKKRDFCTRKEKEKET